MADPVITTDGSCPYCRGRTFIAIDTEPRFQRRADQNRADRMNHEARRRFAMNFPNQDVDWVNHCKDCRDYSFYNSVDAKQYPLQDKTDPTSPIDTSITVED